MGALLGPSALVLPLPPPTLGLLPPPTPGLLLHASALAARLTPPKVLMH